jgi:hypothetical protein
VQRIAEQLMRGSEVRINSSACFRGAIGDVIALLQIWILIRRKCPSP